jgi:tRNA-modifying protein YgfZ
MSADQDIAADASALEISAGFRLRTELCVLRVCGDDRASWLNGQVTTDLRELDPARGIRALSVNVRGKILAELWISATPDSLILLVPRAAEAALLESFERYIIMEDVELAIWREAGVLSLQGPRSAELAAQLPVLAPAVSFSCDELGQGGQVWVDELPQLEKLRAQLRALDMREVGEGGYELARLRAGVPRYGIDFGEKNYPQEAGLKASVSFAKGCYLGQEVVCTLENRGRLTRRLSLLRGSGDATPAPGTVLTDAHGETLGEITSAVFDPDAAELVALGYVKRAQAQPNLLLTAAGSELVLARVIGEESAL